MKTILVSGDIDTFRVELDNILKSLDLLPHQLIDIKYSTTHMENLRDWYVVHSALIIYNKNEPTTAATKAPNNY